MKQANHLGTPKATGASSMMSRRRLMGQVVLGSAAALVLSACGGGGSSSTNDSTSAQEARLIWAYDRIEEWMIWSDVEELVGFPANNERAQNTLIWVVGKVRLYVAFHSAYGKEVSYKALKNGDAPEVTYGF